MDEDRRGRTSGAILFKQSDMTVTCRDTGQEVRRADILYALCNSQAALQTHLNGDSRRAACTVPGSRCLRYSHGPPP